MRGHSDVKRDLEQLGRELKKLLMANGLEVYNDNRKLALAKILDQRKKLWRELKELDDARRICNKTEQI